MIRRRLRRPAWYSVSRVDEQDIGRQLGLIGPGAWAILALYTAVLLTLALVFGEPTSSSPAGITIILGLVFGAGLIASPSSTPFPTWRTIFVILIVVFAVATISARQHFHDHAPGQAAWELGCGNFLLFGLALRKRVIAAWLGEIAMLGALYAWSITVTGSPQYGLSFSYGQPVSLLAGTVFAVALHRAAERIVDFRAAERERAVIEARDHASNNAHDLELKLVRELAVPILQQIADGAEPDRGEVRTTEAALRDLIRGRSLAVEPLVAALRLTRQRGVDVVLLDDLGESPLPAWATSQVAEWCALQLESVASASVTIRLAKSGRGALVTLVDGAGRLYTKQIAAGTETGATTD